jgi:putative glycosyltransferase
MHKISVVTSLYRSVPYIREFHARHVACLETLGVEFEFVFVNDGSPDDSADVVKELIASHPGITLVCLSKNFGQHAAMFAGLAHATGTHICALDCDLEEQPENLAGMFKMMQADPDIDVVYGVVDRRTAGFVRNWLSDRFWSLLNWLSNLNLPPNQAWQRLMSKQYVEQLLRFQETQSLPAGLMELTGFNQRPYLIEKHYKGSTSYSFTKRLHLAVNSVVSFSSVPLLVISCFGLCVTLVSFVCIALLVLFWLCGHEYQSGWPSVIASIWCVGGLVLLSVGVVGIYLARVFDQVKNRPPYIVRKIIRS